MHGVCVYVGGWTICARYNVRVDSDHSFVELVLSLDHFMGSSSEGSNSDQIMSLQGKHSLWRSCETRALSLDSASLLFSCFMFVS